MRKPTLDSSEPGSRACANTSCSQLVSSHNGNATAQLATKIQHTVGSLNILDADRVVGVRMNAHLEPDDPVVGSATGKNTEWMQWIRKQHPKANVVRGHLLNHDLGGFAMEENLFPISTKANSDHSTEVEQKVKGALTWANSNEGHVDYSVNVNQQDSYKKAQFQCDWAVYDKYGAKQDGEAKNIQSELGKDVGGFGGWGKTKKSPVAWRHGKSKGGSEVDSVRTRIDNAMKDKKVEFSKAPKDGEGVLDTTNQDSLEFLNDLAEEYGVEMVYEALGELLEGSLTSAQRERFIEYRNILAQKPEMVIEIDE
ncbi:MAG: hypothetical protein Crog4KO_23670 [Crocinitomicaceae bacterium]